VNGLYDTNILVDYLSGVAAAKALLTDDPDPAISLITWMEILIGAADDEEMDALRSWLDRFEVCPIEPVVAERAVTLRRHRRIRLPDAIIQATAEVHNRLLFTRNTRDFPEGTPGIRVPYRLPNP
jgi:predicted nucleic acid-binding protein